MVSRACERASERVDLPGTEGGAKAKRRSALRCEGAKSVDSAIGKSR